MEWSCAVAIFAFLAVAFLAWFFQRRIQNLPPGPLCLPLLGYAPFMGKHPHVTLAKLAKKYGSVFTLPMGCKNVLVLNDWTSVKETLVQKAEVFSGRPRNALNETVMKYKDIIFSSGDEWKERRRFTLHHLRDLGFGKKSMEDVVVVEVDKLLGRLQLNPSMDDVGEFFYFSFMNIIWSLVGGKSFDAQDKYMLKFADSIKTVLREFANCNLVAFLPWLRYIPEIFHRALKAQADLMTFFDAEIDEHIKTYQKDHQRDFIDSYLREIFRHQELGSNTNSFTRDNLRLIMMNLFIAGTDTGSTTMSWALLYMITWPEIQRKVQDELDEVVGRARLPTLSDKHLLPYTEAVVLEVHRYCSLGSLSLPHCTTAATTVRSYDIPSDMVVLENIWAIHNDVGLWGDPEVFRPERFLDSGGRVQKPEYLIPFSVGSRYCLGDSLAKMEIFLFFTSLLYKFSFSKHIGLSPPTLDPIFTITLCPHPFSLIAKPRH